jgi:hypothetical protein
MKRWLQFSIILAVSYLLLACQVSAPGAAFVSPPPPPATSVPPPAAGKATVVGQVLSLNSRAPLANIPVRLAEVYRQGDQAAMVLDGAFSPGDITDDQGQFVIEDVAPGEYVIIVGDVTAEYEVIAEPPGKARVWELASDQVLNAGILQVNLGSR